MLGLLGLRIFQATSADIADLGEEHGSAAPMGQYTANRDEPSGPGRKPTGTWPGY
jgi:hypothetical protein